MYEVVFIDNVTHEEKVVQTYSQKIGAIRYCKSFAVYVNGKYINALGEYKIIERKEVK